MSDLSNWQFRGQKLAQDVEGADFVTSESTLLLVSQTPTYNPTAINNAEAVALTQDLQFDQQRQVVQVQEVGSNQKYTISSNRTQDSMNISRALFDGKSLMRALAPGFPSQSFSEGDRPGYGDFLLNIGSSLFSKPVGLFAIFRDMENNPVGGVFFERTFVMSHNMQISSQSPFLGEGVQLMFDDLRPVDTSGNGSGGA